MKHVKALSNAKPAEASTVAWVELKNIIGPVKLRPVQLQWLINLVDSEAYVTRTSGWANERKATTIFRERMNE